MLPTEPTTNLVPVVISVDTETGGNTAGSVIYQIAAVNHTTGADFNVYIDRHNCLVVGLHEDESTYKWWAEKPAELWERVTGGTTPLQDALDNFAGWIRKQRQGDAPIEVYMKSPSFDSEKILKPAYEIFGEALPWTFREERDFRTIEAVAAAAGMRAYEPPKDAHDALVDAKAQAVYVEMILSAVYDASMLAQETFQQKLLSAPQPLLAQPKEISKESASALNSQVGGDHYKRFGEFQPVKVLQAWLTPEEFKGYCKGQVIAYLAREAEKGGRLDIEKSSHWLKLFLELTENQQ